MNSKHFDLIKDLISPSYAQQAEEARNSHSKQITALLSHRRLPETGWDDPSIRVLLQELASFDTNNFDGNVGVGEREGRVISDLVYQRHYGLTHGIGRSGDVMAEQPKAAGSSLIVQLTKYLALDAIRIAGIKATKTCAVLPAATGLTMTLVFLAMKQLRPKGKYVVWSRIDQKSCFKAIGAAGLTPIVIQLKKSETSDALSTDLDAMRSEIERIGAEEVLCICTTTSTFAPRIPDCVDQVAVLAKELDVPHVINNAYGLQCSKICHMIEMGCRNGRIDAFVQSTDKNFMVPVGGAIVAAPTNTLPDKVSSLYPGRASMSPILDLFITLLSLGAPGWKGLLSERKENMVWFGKELDEVARAQGLRLLSCPSNTISYAIDLSPLAKSMEAQGQGDIDHLTFLGSALFTRRISGPRVVLCDRPAPTTTEERGEGEDEEPTAAIEVRGKYKKKIDGVAFESYGAHADTYPCCYLTAACAIGASRKELSSFLDTFKGALDDYRKGAGRKDKKDKEKDKNKEKPNKV